MVFTLAKLYASRILRNDFLLMNMSMLGEVDYQSLIQRHYESKALVSCVFAKQPKSDIFLMVNAKENALVKIVEQQSRIKIRLSFAAISSNRQLEILSGVKVAGLFVFGLDVCKVFCKFFKEIKNLDDEMLSFLVNN